MEEDSELDQVISNALSLQEDYPDLYLPLNDKNVNVSDTLPQIPLNMEVQKPLNSSRQLKDTLVELYSILGIPHEPPITNRFNLRKDQSTSSTTCQDEQPTKQPTNGFKIGTSARSLRSLPFINVFYSFSFSGTLPEDEMEMLKRSKELKEDQTPSTSGQKCRKRTLYTKQQTIFLQKQFDFNPYPDYVSRCCFAQVTGIPEPRIQVWFQNRRARHQTKLSPSQEAGGTVGKLLAACKVSQHPEVCKNSSAIPPTDKSE
ncbi:homeobox protein siamois-like [Dendrobates tinctorius]|uniref:homeobox protein siamois-like n=1 Tax=Dendrobates tinctorius TaxID=92724 RepID=UPI003CC9BD76